jgi:hypothetical protein
MFGDNSSEPAVVEALHMSSKLGTLMRVVYVIDMFHSGKGY